MTHRPFYLFLNHAYLSIREHGGDSNLFDGQSIPLSGKRACPYYKSTRLTTPLPEAVKAS